MAHTKRPSAVQELPAHDQNPPGLRENIVRLRNTVFVCRSFAFAAGPTVKLDSRPAGVIVQLFGKLSAQGKTVGRVFGPGTGTIGTAITSEGERRRRQYWQQRARRVNGHL